MSKTERIEALESALRDLSERHRALVVRVETQKSHDDILRLRHEVQGGDVLARLKATEARLATLEATTATVHRVGELEERVDGIERITSGNDAEFVERLDTLERRMAEMAGTAVGHIMSLQDRLDGDGGFGSTLVRHTHLFDVLTERVDSLCKHGSNLGRLLEALTRRVSALEPPIDLPGIESTHGPLTAQAASVRLRELREQIQCAEATIASLQAEVARLRQAAKPRCVCGHRMDEHLGERSCSWAMCRCEQATPLGMEVPS